MTHFPTAHIVIDDTHKYTLSRLVYQCIRYQIAQGIIFDDIHVDVDMMFCLGDIFQQLREERIAVRHDIYLIILERQRERLVDKEVDQLLVSLRHA